MRAAKPLIKDALARVWPAGRGRHVILGYHSVGSGSRYSQPLESFAIQMRILEPRYRVVPLAELISQAGAARESLAAITFDDGYQDTYTRAFPILSRIGLPFTVFVTTGFVERSFGFEWSPHYRGLEPLDWNQLREMQRHGATIGSHTHFHKRLATSTTRRIVAEVETSKRILEEKLGGAVDLFAYPFGQPHDYDRRTRALVAEAGYTSAFTTLQRSFATIQDRFEIPRILIDASDGVREFEDKISGRRDYLALVERFHSTLVARGLAPRPLGAAS